MYVDPRVAAEVRARKALVHKLESARKRKATAEAMAYIASLSKVGK